jgi:predicted transcriptional regulator
MTLTLDPAIEARLQRELAASHYAEPSDLLAHALDLIEAERTGAHPTIQAMNDWLLRNKEAINAGLDESFAAKEHGESYSPEEAEALLAEHRAVRMNQAA